LERDDEHKVSEGSQDNIAVYGERHLHNTG